MKRYLAMLLVVALVVSSSIAFAIEIQPRASALIVDRFIYAYDYGDGQVEFAVDMTSCKKNVALRGQP